MKKRGALDISFGMIFSIIIIIAIVAIAFYAISFFLNLGSCTELALTLTDLQEHVNAAWNSEITRDTYELKSPRGVEALCIGNLRESGSGPEYEHLKKFGNPEHNTFIYPVETGCDVRSIKLEKANTDLPRFTCFESVNGKIRIQIEKDSSDTLVQIRKP